MNTRYTGICSTSGNAVIVERDGDIESLGSYCSIKDHSPEFSWGYGGSAPAQTAFAILCDHFKNTHRMRPELAYAVAEILYRHFEFYTISKLPHDEPFELSGELIDVQLRGLLSSYIKLKEHAESLLTERLTVHAFSRTAAPSPAPEETIADMERESRPIFRHLGL